MSTGGTVEIETLSAMSGGMYPSLSTMLEAIALITIIFAIAGVGIFSIMDAAMKWITPRYPLLEIAALRGAVSLPRSIGVRSSATTRPANNRLDGKATAMVSANGA